MAKAEAPNDDSAFDRFLRFGAALFAVRKDELPKREAKPEKQKATRGRKKAP
jgi:hypothetical protein